MDTLNKKEQYYSRIQEAKDYLNERISFDPKVGIVLGTGLGSFANKIERPESIAYSDIPHFPQSTVKGHAGNLIYGSVNEVPVLALQGRFHYYEGYSMKEVTFPISVLRAVGIKSILISNAAGGVMKITVQEILYSSPIISVCIMKIRYVAKMMEDWARDSLIYFRRIPRNS